MIEKKLHIASFNFEAGGHIDGIDVTYHVSKESYAPGDKVIWICHALTANSDPEDWWPQLVGPGKFFDTEKYFIACVNMLCSPYGSSGPASIDPKSGKAYYFNFPATTVRDMINASIAVRKELGVENIDLLIGCSIGGFQAIEWAVAEPEVFRNVAFVATAPRISPWLSAMAEAQRMALEADPSFRACEDIHGGEAGLKCARAQALITYRCHEGYGLTQAEADPDTLFAGRAASYERYQGEKLVKRNFDAYSYKYLCDALDSHNVGRGRGGVDSALASIKAHAIVVAVDTDLIFTPQESETWRNAIPDMEYHLIHSSFGHDGFLLENEQLTKIIEPVLCKY